LGSQLHLIFSQLALLFFSKVKAERFVTMS
jgi:hypothetical protein